MDIIVRKRHRRHHEGHVKTHTHDAKGNVVMLPDNHRDKRQGEAHDADPLPKFTKRFFYQRNEVVDGFLPRLKRHETSREHSHDADGNVVYSEALTPKNPRRRRVAMGMESGEVMEHERGELHVESAAARSRRHQSSKEHSHDANGNVIYGETQKAMRRFRRDPDGILLLKKYREKNGKGVKRE